MYKWIIEWDNKWFAVSPSKMYWLIVHTQTSTYCSDIKHRSFTAPEPVFHIHHVSMHGEFLLQLFFQQHSLPDLPALVICHLQPLEVVNIRRIYTHKKKMLNPYRCEWEQRKSNSQALAQFHFSQWGFHRKLPDELYTYRVSQKKLIVYLSFFYHNEIQSI